MAGIYHNFVIKASVAEVFKEISTVRGLNSWWTKKAEGKPISDIVYHLHFGEGYDWEAVVTKCEKDKRFELQMTIADKEWMKTKIGFNLTEVNEQTVVEFYHKGWESKSEQFKQSNFCWALYLRILRRHVEYGEKVAFEKRGRI